MRPIIQAAAILISILAPVAHAEDGTGCEKFAWSVARERAWFAVADKISVAAGETLAPIPRGAFVFKLLSANEAKFAMPPERKARAEIWYGGSISLPAVERAGIFQITLSQEAWIDVIQGGRYARSVGSTGRSDCPGLRKSVRLELEQAPFIVQLSGVGFDAVTMAIGPRE
jgi:hypothetical protein